MEKPFSWLEKAALCAMAVCVVLSVCSFAKDGDSVKNAVLRLHVIANSDTPEDQALKLRVRDALLKKSGDLAAAESKQQAAQTIEAQLETLKDAAKRVVAQQGFRYDVALSLEHSAFPTRTYGDVTLPAGEYDALRVVIGEGKGQNWWCVMFPPLCLPAASNGPALGDVLDEDALALVHEAPQYDVRFWIVEQWEKLKAKWAQKAASRQQTIDRSGTEKTANKAKNCRLDVLAACAVCTMLAPSVTRILSCEFTTALVGA